MAQNIFENAYFGKPYKTRGDRKAIFLRKLSSDSNFVVLLIESDFDFKRIYVHLNGTSAYDRNRDIISECQEINEEELDKLALEYVNKQWLTNYKELNEITDDLDLQAVDDFKAGYYKAKEL